MTGSSSPAVQRFLASLPYEPDAFQIEAIGHVADGVSVVVTAPTGAGKTLIAEAAVEVALERGERTFYTTPIKALSNQKFGDLRTVHGAAAVGLLTGDNVVNGEAPIIVMTTEVLRNMIYTDPGKLESLGMVILDEVHYLQDRYRGPVWEEVIIHLPQHVQLVNLSATIANAAEFTEWVRRRRGPTELVIETHRPVPLESLFMVKDRHRDNRLELFPVFGRKAGTPNPEVVRLLRKGRGRFRRFTAPRRLEVVEELAGLGRLPAIYFIFSRAGCDQAAQRVAAAGLALTTDEERHAVRRLAEERTAHLSADDLAALGYATWAAGLEAGVAPHHAGLVPAFKETVEALFAAGLVKVVFATETLALGINMPARTVVLEQLSKFTGEGHELLRPGDYTQLSGRAGRRGIDRAGTAVILHQRDVPFDKIAAIASQGSHPLVSSFTPTYNMAVNLVANYPQGRAEELLQASFAQHRLESRQHELRARLAQREAEIAEFTAAARCERGDVVAHAAGNETGDVRQMLRDFAQDMIPGHVLEIPAQDGSDRWVLLARGFGPNPRLHLVAPQGRERTVAADDLSPNVAIVGVVDLPEPFRPRDRSYRAAVVANLGELQVDDRMRRSLDLAPNAVAACPHLGEHLAWLERAKRAEKEAQRLQRRLERSADDLVVKFRSLLGLLGELGYVTGWTLTAKGQKLRVVYNELDLLVTEAAMAGHLDALSPAELAGVATLFVYEPRRDDVPGGMPSPAADHAVEAIFELSDDLAKREEARGIDVSRLPFDGYVERLHDWAQGATLDDLFDDEGAAGDFVRIARQTLDLLRQMRDAFPRLSAAAAMALELVDRGVVAAESRW